MRMFTVCLDASGCEDDQQYLVVAGFVSSAQDWMEFDRAWTKRLKEDGIEYFHMKEFAHFTDQFKHGWRGKENEPKRQRLLSDLMFIIKSYAYRKIGCVIENKVLQDTWSKEQRESYYLNAYALAGMTCAQQVYTYYHSPEYESHVPLDFVFEDGDSGKGKLMERFKADLGFHPTFKPKRDVKNPQGIATSFTPLQAADFLAYEIFKRCKDRSQENFKERWGYKEFNSMVGPLGIYDVTSLEQLEKHRQVCETTFGMFS